MNNVFISHSTKDKMFVNLLVYLLEHHRINAWCDSYNLEPGIKVEQEINEAITKSEALLVVVSNNTIPSKWVTEEIARFSTLKPNSKIIPILLEKEIDLDAIFHGLNNYLSIDFSSCHLAGYQKLFKIFNKDFLPHIDRRGETGRRKIEDRRSKKERRGVVFKRMQYGFWKSFTETAEITELLKIEIWVSRQLKIRKALMTEAQRYRYFDRESGKEKKYEEVLSRGIRQVWNEMEDMGKHEEYAVDLIKLIAERIFDEYEVTHNDRRTEKDRRVNEDRRQLSREKRSVGDVGK